MLPENKISLLKTSGLSMVCSTCSKYAKGVELGLDRCTAKDGCGSPIIGDTFHEYEGPITDFVRYCFVCGEKPTKAIRVKGHVRVLAACDVHVEYVAQLAPKVDRPKPPAPKTLSSLLMQLSNGTFKLE